VGFRVTRVVVARVAKMVVTTMTSRRVKPLVDGVWLTMWRLEAGTMSLMSLLTSFLCILIESIAYMLQEYLWISYYKNQNAKTLASRDLA